MERFSLKRLCGEGLGKRGAPSLGTLEDSVRKAVDKSISVHGGPSRSEGTPEDMCKKGCG
jgi:hypothetical protein